MSTETLSTTCLNTDYIDILKTTGRDNLKSAIVKRYEHLLENMCTSASDSTIFMRGLFFKVSNPEDDFYKILFVFNTKLNCNDIVELLHVNKNEESEFDLPLDSHLELNIYSKYVPSSIYYYDLKADYQNIDVGTSVFFTHTAVSRNSDGSDYDLVDFVLSMDDQFEDEIVAVRDTKKIMEGEEYCKEDFFSHLLHLNDKMEYEEKPIIGIPELKIYNMWVDANNVYVAIDTRDSNRDNGILHKVWVEASKTHKSLGSHLGFFGVHTFHSSVLGYGDISVIDYDLAKHDYRLLPLVKNVTIEQSFSFRSYNVKDATIFIKYDALIQPFTMCKYMNDSNMQTDKIERLLPILNHGFTSKYIFLHGDSDFVTTPCEVMVTTNNPNDNNQYTFDHTSIARTKNLFAELKISSEVDFVVHAIPKLLHNNVYSDDTYVTSFIFSGNGHTLAEYGTEEVVSFGFAPHKRLQVKVNGSNEYLINKEFVNHDNLVLNPIDFTLKEHIQKSVADYVVDIGDNVVLADEYVIIGSEDYFCPELRSFREFGLYMTDDSELYLYGTINERNFDTYSNYMPEKCNRLFIKNITTGVNTKIPGKYKILSSEIQIGSLSLANTKQYGSPVFITTDGDNHTFIKYGDSIKAMPLFCDNDDDLHSINIYTFNDDLELSYLVHYTRDDAHHHIQAYPLSHNMFGILQIHDGKSIVNGQMVENTKDSVIITSQYEFNKNIVQSNHAPIVKRYTKSFSDIPYDKISCGESYITDIDAFVRYYIKNIVKTDVEVECVTIDTFMARSLFASHIANIVMCNDKYVSSVFGYRFSDANIFDFLDKQLINSSSISYNKNTNTVFMINVMNINVNMMDGTFATMSIPYAIEIHPDYADNIIIMPYLDMRGVLITDFKQPVPIVAEDNIDVTK